MAKKPQKSPAITKQEEALKLQCKALYFEFATVESIHRKTGVDRRKIQNWVYGSGNIYDVDENSWLHERSLLTREEQEELMLRNRHLSVVLHSQAITEILSSLDELKNRKTKRGKKIPLSAFDMKQVSDTVLNVQKMNIVAGMNKPEDLPQPALINSNLNQDEVIDMEAVAFAIKKDKAIMKLIEGSNHGTRKAATETEIIRSYEARASADVDRATASERTSRERSSEKSDREDYAERTRRGRQDQADKNDSDSIDRGAQTNGSDRNQAGSSPSDRRSSESLSDSDREPRTGDSGFEERSDIGEGTYEDGFADEYS